MPTPTSPSLKVFFSFTRRGATQLFTNRYYLDSTPATDADWLALFQDVYEGANGATHYLLPALSTEVTIVKGVGYHGGSDISVWEHDLSAVGQRTLSGEIMSSDSALMMRWATAARTSKGHPIYLFNWMHGVSGETAAPDTLETGLRTAFQGYAQEWWDAGFSDGSTTYRRVGPFGAAAISSEVDQFVRHRDFPS